MSTDTFRYAAPADWPTHGIMKGARTLPRYPSLTSTVPKELVHRAAVAEVLLTGWGRTDGGRFTASAQWPRGHSFFTPISGSHYDPLMIMETIRQVGSLIAHTEFDVPLGHQFLLRDLQVSVSPEHLRVEGVPAALDIEITYTDVKRRRYGHAGAHYETVVSRDGQVVATGAATYTCTTPEVYQRVRGDRVLRGDWPQLQLTAPVSPQSVGRVSPIDVVLSPVGEAHRWQLRVDTRHPILFDHPVDHVPGMVLIEAARQAATAVLKGTSLVSETELMPSRIVSKFRRYTELDSPCLIEAHPIPTGPDEAAVLVTGLQNGDQVFNCTVAADSAQL
ncbi:ScbA/BarX family gamma-butyrolactone biosynthesis protein [Streptomyces sp. NPDC059076]|uniref:ScbA/BarX family gamma-butyrolactone biosynthesis protein n=1 Tax=unclassified Streptomyces TaxID=2593676 RepID=UPI0036AA6CFA